MKAGLVVDDEAAVQQQPQGELLRQRVITTQIPAYQAAALRQNAGDEARDRNSSRQSNVRWFGCCAMRLVSHGLQNVLGPEVRCAMPCHAVQVRQTREHQSQAAAVCRAAELSALTSTETGAKVKVQKGPLSKSVCDVSVLQ